MKKKVPFEKPLQDELKEIAPGLSKLERRNAFRVPQDYFSNLGDNIVGKIREQKEEKRAPVLWLKLSDWMDELVSVIFRPRIALAGSVAILITIVGVHYFTRPGTGSLPATMAEVSHDDAQEYIVNHIDLFDDEMLISASSGDIDWTQMEKELKKSPKENIDQYLIDDFDESLLDNVQI